MRKANYLGIKPSWSEWLAPKMGWVLVAAYIGFLIYSVVSQLVTGQPRGIGCGDF